MAIRRWWDENGQAMNILAALQFYPKTRSCAVNYAIFALRFGRIHSEEGYRQFCRNLAEFFDYAPSCASCEITSVFDQDFSLLASHPQASLGNEKGFLSCYEAHCYTYSPFPALDRLPDAIDHRMMGLTTSVKDQKGCGSCWSFGLAEILENALLLAQEKTPIQFWRRNAVQLDLSEQFFLRNIYGFQRFCSGGDAVMAINYMVDANWKTVELEQNCKYDYNQQNLWRDNVTVYPKIPESSQYVPYRLFERAKILNVFGTPMTPVVKLADASFFDQNAVKAYLARGIAVLGAMNTAVSREAQQKLSAYNGKLPVENVGCNRVGLANHQVVFIGYGKFKGEDVWIVKNSWGKWGNHGCFYVRRGRNDYCIENYGYAIIGKQHDLNSQAFDQTKPFVSAFPKLRRGEWGIDREDGTYSTLSTFESVWVWVVLGSVLGVGFFSCVGVAIYFVQKRRKQRMREKVKFYDGYSDVKL